MWHGWKCASHQLSDCDIEKKKKRVKIIFNELSKWYSLNNWNWKKFIKIMSDRNNFLYLLLLIQSREIVISFFFCCTSRKKSKFKIFFYTSLQKCAQVVNKVKECASLKVIRGTRAQEIANDDLEKWNFLILSIK